MNEMVVKEYLGNGITFKNIEGQIYANATDMAKVFNKQPSDWTKLKSTKEYIELLEGSEEIPMGSSVIVINDGFNNGTYIHEKLILDYSRWLDLKFRIWADKAVAELIKEGFVSIQPQFKAPTSLKEALLLALEQQEKIELLELENSKKETKLIEQAPKVEFADILLKSKANVLIGDFAKVLNSENMNIGSNRLFEWLRENEYLYKDKKGNNLPYQTYVDKGYFVVKENVIDSAFKTFITFTTLITPNGQVYLYNKLKNIEKFNKK